MRTISILLVLLSLHLPAMAQLEAQSDPILTAEKQVRARVATFGDAFKTADAERLAPMLTDDYIHTGPTGNVSDKAGWLGWLRSRRGEMDAGTFRFDRYANDEIAVRVFGDAAVVTGRNISVGVRNGEPFDLEIRFTQFWVRQEGVWRRAAFHDSLVEAEN